MTSALFAMSAWIIAPPAANALGPSAGAPPCTADATLAIGAVPMLPVAVPLLPESVDDGRPCVTSLPPARSERSVWATRTASAFLR